MVQTILAIIRNLTSLMPKVQSYRDKFETDNSTSVNVFLIVAWNPNRFHCMNCYTQKILIRLSATPAVFDVLTVRFV